MKHERCRRHRFNRAGRVHAETRLRAAPPGQDTVNRGAELGRHPAGSRRIPASRGGFSRWYRAAHLPQGAGRNDRQPVQRPSGWESRHGYRRPCIAWSTTRYAMKICGDLRPRPHRRSGSARYRSRLPRLLQAGGIPVRLASPAHLTAGTHRHRSAVRRRRRGGISGVETAVTYVAAFDSAQG